jgi:hypothetical protein
VADLTVRGSFGQDQQDVGPAMVAVMSLIVGLAGWGLLVLLERTNANARTVWTATATAVLIGSLAGPVGAGIGTATKVALVCIHLAVAAVLIPVLATTSASR